MLKVDFKKIQDFYAGDEMIEYTTSLYMKYVIIEEKVFKSLSTSLYAFLKSEISFEKFIDALYVNSVFYNDSLTKEDFIKDFLIVHIKPIEDYSDLNLDDLLYRFDKIKNDSEIDKSKKDILLTNIDVPLIKFDYSKISILKDQVLSKIEVDAKNKGSNFDKNNAEILVFGDLFINREMDLPKDVSNYVKIKRQELSKGESNKDLIDNGDYKKGTLKFKYQTGLIFKSLILKNIESQSGSINDF